MRAVHRLVLAAMALGAGAVMVAAPAPAAVAPVRVHRISQRAPVLSMDQAVSMVEHRYKARVVRAETRTQGDRTIYILRMLDDVGRVFYVRVDAASGTIL